MAPVGIGLLTGIKSPHKIERLSNAFFEEAGCALNDMDCMRYFISVFSAFCMGPGRPAASERGLCHIDRLNSGIFRIFELSE